MADLPEPDFLERDPQVILAEWIASYEAKTGKKLTPAMAEYQLCAVGSYRETLTRIGVQETGKQNLVRYAVYPMLDFLAEMQGDAAARLPARAATTTLEWTLAAAPGADFTIPAGRRIRSADKKVTFISALDCVVKSGETTTTVLGSASVIGSIGNGYDPGDISELLDDLGVTATVTNLTTSEGGRAEEGTEEMRTRFPDAVANYALAGPEDAYRVLALAVHPDIIDVYVANPTPLDIVLYILTKTGTASSELCDLVTAALTPEKKRPMGDTVSSQSATATNYTIDVALTLYAGEDSVASIAAAEDVLADYAAARKAGLGRAPADGQISGELRAKVAAVYNVTVNEPSPLPVVASSSFANCTSITVTVAGYVAEKRPTL